MKKYIISTLLTLLCISSIFAQSPPHQFRYQALLRNSSGSILANKSVDVRVEIVDPENPETVLFSENHTVTTNDAGVFDVNIGSKSDLSSIEWGHSNYMVRLSIDGSVIALGSLNSVPQAVYTLSADSVIKAGYASVAGSPDFSGWDKNAADDFIGNYYDLTDQPVTITDQQKSKLDSLYIGKHQDLDELSAQVSENATKTSFPGFGEEAGKAFVITWTQAGGNVFYDEGSAGIGLSGSIIKSGAALQVAGGIRFDGEPKGKTPGLLFYDPAGTGFFYYFDDDSAKKVLGASSVSLTWTNVMGGYNNDLILHRHLAAGTGTYAGMPFGENIIILSADTLSLYFNDTSNSSAFPNTDWIILINDRQNGGRNYFAIRDSLHRTTPFAIFAGTNNHSIILGENGNIGIDTLPGDEKLRVHGTLKAGNFMGNSSGLSNIPGAGTSSVENTGSTTISADSDDDNAGSVLFKTGDTTRFEIFPGGNVGINKPVSNSGKLNVNGSMLADELTIGGNLTTSLLSRAIVYDTIPENFYFNYDVQNKNFLFARPEGVVSIYSILPGSEGQQLTIVNNGNAGQIILYPYVNIRETTTITLDEYESASLVYANGFWVVISSYTIP